MALLDMIFLLFINLVWGMNFLAAKWAVADFPPLVANALRFLMVSILLLPFLKPVPGRMKDLLIVAFVLGVLHFGLIFVAMKLSGGVSAMAIVAQLNVPFATLMAVFFLRERIGWKRSVGITISFLGVMVLGFDPAVFEYLDAVIWMAASAFVYSFSTILMRRLKAVPAITTQAWVGLLGFSGSVVLSSLFEHGQFDAIDTAGTLAWVAVAYSALMSSIVGHGGINYLLTKYEVSTISPYFVLTPVFAILGGVVVLGETLTQEMIYGGLLTLVGVGVVTFRNARRGGRALKDAEEVGREVAE